MHKNWKKGKKTRVHTYLEFKSKKRSGDSLKRWRAERLKSLQSGRDLTFGEVTTETYLQNSPAGEEEEFDKLKSLQSGRDLTLGEVTTETYLQNSPAREEEEFDKLKSLQSGRDLTLGGVTTETYLQNSPAGEEEEFDNPKDSSQNDCTQDYVLVDKTKQVLANGSRSIRSPEDQITEKSLNNYDKLSLKIEPVSSSEKDGYIDNIPKILNPAPLFREGQCAPLFPSANCDFILPDVARILNESPITIKKDLSADDPFALKEIKTEPLGVEFESLITIEQNLEPEILLSEFPTVSQPSSTVDPSFSINAAQPVQSPEEPEIELGFYKNELVHHPQKRSSVVKLRPKNYKKGKKTRDHTYLEFKPKKRSGDSLKRWRAERLKSLQSGRDLTLGEVTTETYLQNSPAGEEEEFDNPKDSGQKERSYDKVSVDMTKQILANGSESNLLWLRSPEDQITEKSLE